MSPHMRMDLVVNDFVYRAITGRAVMLLEPHFERIERAGYKPEFSLDRGIAELIRGYRMIRPNPYTNL